MKNWKWYGKPGHFICADQCKFHLCTKVGRYLVSTVGEMWLSRRSREIHAEVYEIKWLQENKHLLGDAFDSAYMKKFGYEDIGCDRKYETMVFRFKGSCKDKECKCGMPKIIPRELDFAGYNDGGSATKGHMKICKKWSKK